jgi:GntR family transcriptional repressor for pyruvate dehydrogenase complex
MQDKRSAAAAGLLPVNRMRSVDDIVAQLRDALSAGRIQPGERLPSERELTETFGVSRATVREALRSLEATGLLDIRLGATGGAFALTPDPSLMGEALATLLMFRRASERDLAEFRLTFEQENARLAASRASPEHRAQLAVLLRRAHDAAPGRKGWAELENIDFEVHQLLPRATGNSVRIAIAHGIHDAVRRSFDRIEPQPDSPATLRRDVVNVVTAVLATDGADAAKQMDRHMRRWVRRASD